MTSKFTVGNKIVRVVDGGCDLKFGGVYEVEYVSSDAGAIRLVNDPHGYYAGYFELAEEKPTFKNMKFKVDSPEQSEEVQEALFSMGYKWAGEDHRVMYLDSKWLTSWDDGSLGVDEHAFNLNTGQEYTLRTTKSYEFVPVVTEAIEETVELMGQKYSKKELEDALRGLKPVN